MYNTRLLFSALLCFAFSISYSQKLYTVSTYAGQDSAGYKNGANSTALFNAPTGLAADSSGNVYIADTYNNVIRIALFGINLTHTLAGNDTEGYRNGSAGVAEFNTPFGVCVDKTGNVYVADTYNNVIRKISTSGMVTTFAGNDTAGYRNGADSIAEFNLPTGVASDTLGNIYVADNQNNVIREISTSGMVTTFAGNDTVGSDTAGYKNGNADTALFNGLYGITVDDSGSVYVTEYLNNDVRKIRKGVVTTIAGNDTMATTYGFRNGKLDTVLFNNPAGIVVDASGNVYVADEYNNAIRKISKDSVTTFAGNISAGLVNGLADTAEFNEVLGLALDNRGNFYVADNGNNLIRMIAPAPPLGVATLSSTPSTMLAYPNPCNDKLVIAKAPLGKAEMYDMMGREVWSQEQFKAPFILSTGSLMPGVYFLRVSNIEESATMKVMIQR